MNVNPMWTVTDGNDLLERVSLEAVTLGVTKHSPDDNGEFWRADPSQASCPQSSVRADWPPRATIDAFGELKSISSSVPSARQPRMISF
jgi:hypothetical protein